MKRYALLVGIAAAVIGVALYVAWTHSANAPTAQATDTASAGLPLRQLIAHPAPKPVPDGTLTQVDGAEARLSDFRGKMVVLNFWATWCAPCREEMPSLNALQNMRGGDDFEVVVLATGRNSPAAITRFFDEVQIDALAPFQDPDMALARQMGVLGLPVTVVLNPQGQEIARLTGDADWSGADALASLELLGLGKR